MQFDLSFSCRKKWTEMKGDNQQRFCNHCDQFVHDFSVLEVEEIEKIMEERDPCARFSINEKGEVKTRRGFVGGLMFASILAGCGTEETKPIQNDPVVQEVKTIENQASENMTTKDPSTVTADDPEKNPTEKKEGTVSNEEACTDTDSKKEMEPEPPFMGRISRPKEQSIPKTNQ